MRAAAWRKSVPQPSMSMRPMEVRRALAVLSLVVLAVSLVTALPVEETRTRFVRLCRSLAGDPTVHPEAMSFWFDPEYAVFLEEVRRQTPESATVAVLVPSVPDVYIYEAYYRLAPRRVVDERWKDEADFIASYRAESGLRPGERPVAFGSLLAR
jgi:hypothetical protein